MLSGTWSADGAKTSVTGCTPSLCCEIAGVPKPNRSPGLDCWDAHQSTLRFSLAALYPCLQINAIRRQTIKRAFRYLHEPLSELQYSRRATSALRRVSFPLAPGGLTASRAHGHAGWQSRLRTPPYVVCIAMCTAPQLGSVRSM